MVELILVVPQVRLVSYLGLCCTAEGGAATIISRRQGRQSHHATTNRHVSADTEPSAPASSPTAGRGDDGRSVGEGGIGERRSGGGLAGVLGGIIGAVVIRGGHGGVDKCDPRTDGRRRGGMGGVLVDRPDFGLPLPTGRPTFPSRL